MTNSPARSPADEPSPGLFELVFPDRAASPPLAADELQRIDWAICPTSMPEDLPRLEVEEIEELRRELNSLQPPVPLSGGLSPPRDTFQGNSLEPSASNLSQSSQTRRRHWSQRLPIWVATAAALAGVAMVLTFSNKPLRDFVWKSAPGTQTGKGASDPTTQPLSEVERARRLVELDYSLVHQTAAFLGEKWLVASRNAELEAGLSTAARTEAIDELDQAMEKLQQKATLNSAEALSLGRWRLKRGEWGLAAQAFRTATQLQSNLSEAWIGRALTVAHRNADIGDTADLRRILAAWMEMQSRKPDQRNPEHEKQVLNDLSDWVSANEKSP